jgi:protein PhnA
LLGKTLTETEKFQMLNAENGFIPNSIYSNEYLNKSGSDGYRGMDIFYGAKAEVRYAQTFDRNGVAAPPIAKPAVMDTSRITDNPAGTQIQAGAILLNGIELPSLETQPNLPLTPADVANWVNGASTIDITEPTFSGLALTLGGVALSVQNLNPIPNDLDTLAGDLQASLRLADGTNYISVSVDSNGTELLNGDTIVLTQGLNVKGVNFMAPKGTIVKKIHLVADNPEQIEGKVNEQTIVILTKFVRKQG